MMRSLPAKSGKGSILGLLGLCLLATMSFAADLSAQAISGCSRGTLHETRLDRGLVLRFFETADALEKAAEELGLKPALARRGLSDTPSPTHIALSLERHEAGRRLLERHLRAGQICQLSDFAVFQRTIYQAQNFIDIGEDDEALNRQLDTACRRVCSSMINIVRSPPIEDCHNKCRKADGDFYQAPPAGNVEVLKSLQSEIPTSYILSWQPGRSR